jgi:hypothetical protein
LALDWRKDGRAGPACSRVSPATGAATMWSPPKLSRRMMERKKGNLEVIVKRFVGLYKL